MWCFETTWPQVIQDTWASETQSFRGDISKRHHQLSRVSWYINKFRDRSLPTTVVSECLTKWPLWSMNLRGLHRPVLTRGNPSHNYTRTLELALSLPKSCRILRQNEVRNCYILNFRDLLWYVWRSVNHKVSLLHIDVLITALTFNCQ